MKFTKIKFDGETVTLEWQELLFEDDRKTTTFESKEDPEPGLNRALQALAPLVLRMIEAPEDWGALVKGVSVKHPGDQRGLVVTAVREIEATNSPFVVNTPYLLESGEGEETAPLAAKVFKALDALEKQAARYIAGHRAQGSLFTS